jgi:hypothetical protein
MTLSKPDSNSAALVRVITLLDRRVTLRVATLLNESALAIIARFVLVLALQFTSVSEVPEDVG